MKFACSTIGDPYSAKTYSGVPFELFKEMDKRNLIATRVNGFRLTVFDYFDGYIDIKKSFAKRKPYRNAFWRYKLKTIKKLSRRLDKNLSKSEFDVFFQIGCGGLPTRDCIRIAHVELPLRTAQTDEVFSKSYGFYDISQETIKSAITGERFFYDNCDIIWTNTEWTAKNLIDCGVNPQKIFIYPPCVSYHGKNPRISRNYDSPRILFIGKDWERKGGPQLVEAFTQLQQEYRDASLDIVGCTPPIALQKGITVHGFLDKKIPEHSDKLDKIFKESNIFCMPSTWESTGIVYMEAMQKGLPVIMTEGQGREILFQNSAKIIKKTDPEDIRNAVLQIIKNPTETSSLIDNGYFFVENKYNYKILVDKLLEKIETTKKME